jgi:hypothetical protein
MKWHKVVGDFVARWCVATVRPQLAAPPPAIPPRPAVLGAGQSRVSDFLHAGMVRRNADDMELGRGWSEQSSSTVARESRRCAPRP